MALFGASVLYDRETNFYAVSARDKEEAYMIINLEFSEQYGVIIKICNLETLLNEQYEGFAILGTI